MRQLLAIALATAVATPVLAETAPSAATAQPGDCAEPAGVAEAATAPAAGDSTAPGNAATGWSGGFGGSQTGTNTAGAVPESQTEQPATARGLDLIGAPEAADC